jgi:hypothetical protein
LSPFSKSWLNNAQAAADSANFMANVKFHGIDEDLTAPNTPWIYYGVRICIFDQHSSPTLATGFVRWCTRSTHEDPVP